MRVERAVFTSPSSGGGYQIVAYSDGVDSKVHRELTSRAPSHSSLVDESSAGGGFAMLRLEQGPWCLMASRTSGAEPSGRAGFRVHTDCFLVQDDDFARFQHNPALFLEAILAQGATRPREATPKLEPIFVAGEAQRFPADKLRAAAEHVGPSAVASVIAAARTEPELLVYAPHACDILAVAVLCGLPESLLAETSVASGLRPSRKRPVRLSFLPCERPTRRNEAIELEGDRYVLEVERLVDEAPAEPAIDALREAFGGGDEQIHWAVDALAVAPVAAE